MPRINGWDKPFHALQVVSWIVFPLFVGSFFVFYTPLLELSAAILGSSTYAIAALTVCFSAFMCTTIDPADEAVAAQSLHIRDTRGSQHQVYCNVCMQYVDKASRHCRLCEKCVMGFDHHCKWLNNCIGRTNYNFFFACIASSTFMMTVQAILGIFILVNTFTSPEVIRQRLASTFGCQGTTLESGVCATTDDDMFSLTAIRIVHFILAGVVVLWWFLISQLLLFHVQLVIEDLTTYDYIVRKRKKKLARDRENAVEEPTCLELTRAGLCCRKLAKDKPTGATMTASRLSAVSSRQIEEEEAVIEAEVDDELEVTSSRGSRQSFPATKSGYSPKRGFGLHLSGRANSTAMGTPASPAIEPVYLEGPFTPRSPRSDPGSAYVSDLSDGDELVEATAAAGGKPSMVMYGRPRQDGPTSGQIV